ncbi:phosphate acyltransferase [Rhodobacterales bacterium 52_120_T64]|nr:phosphate acyltransferase [Rhodobacterales bacterium 52_120_T64]
MTLNEDRTNFPQGAVVVSIDAMGGDSGVEAIVGGIELSAKINPDIRFIIHGDSVEINALLQKKPALTDLVVVRHSDKVVEMDTKPSQAVRSGKGSSMWNTLQSVKDGEATVAVSCGNTGALMMMSVLRLRKLPGVQRPAIAVLWPSRNPSGHNVMLDMGADIKADAEDLLQYAIMGASYARNGLGLKRPRVGLLNIGTENNKGRPEIQEAAELIEASQEASALEYIGFVEGSDLPSDRVDIIVTDGFTGNVALKASEGTAKLVGQFLRDAFTHSAMAKFAAVFASGPLKRLKNRIDPRRVNGGVFLGLNGTVIKSHGSADAIGVSAAIKLAFTLAQNGFSEKLAARVASAAAASKNTTSKTGEA